MNKTESAESKIFRLSKRLSVEITIGVGGMVCEWEPSIPGDGLSQKEMQRYRHARDEMLHRLAAMTGAAVVCIEV